MIDPNKRPALVKKVEVMLEDYVANAVKTMSKHTSISANEIINTALRRFIATHKDYFPSSGKSPVGRVDLRQNSTSSP